MRRMGKDSDPPIVCQWCWAHHDAEFWCNERTYEQYRLLAFAILNRFVATYRIPEQEVPDFEGEIILKLLKSPQSFRANPNGMSMIFKNFCVNYIRGRRKMEMEVSIGGIPSDIGAGNSRHKHALRSR